ncbi:MAG: sulfite exporter TauE/SafE family protein [Betaproteobacteria bacterium]
MPQSALLGAFLAGLLGGLHCFAMCGGWIALAGRQPVVAPLLPAAVLRRRQWVSQFGRVSTYVVLGTLVGAAGGAAIAFAIGPVQRGLYAAANVLLLVLAISIAVRGIDVAPLERIGLALFRRLLPLVARIAQRDGMLTRYTLGLVWGMTPCALTYSVLPVAMFAGNAQSGALVMLAFGLGTLPNLLAAGWLMQRMQRWLANAALRYGAAAIVGMFALLGLYRALLAPETLGDGPFCLVR